MVHLMDRTPAELNLTQEQQEKLQSLRTDSAKETLPLRNEIQIKTLELQQLCSLRSVVYFVNHAC
ncbi:hypothetical protein H8E77_11380 [bacterium]|nr:hypothetical protein [bacterium]